MSFPAPKSSAQHCQEVVEAVERLYSKRAKYNKDFDEITKKGINIAAEQVNIDAEREAIEKSLNALEKRKEELDKAVEAHKKREQESQALLKDIEEDMSRMNQDITNAFLD